ncbi:MAG TPA: hypothetical protein VK436_14270 [Methanocella sp.]|nr:hypothetical protein [Methanocella sp.]
MDEKKVGSSGEVNISIFRDETRTKKDRKKAVCGIQIEKVINRNASQHAFIGRYPMLHTY